uniref:Reverse transcriptase domain-containing protein n=1 Tax=Tanacetum cinerariifolium TaxID=118510 RepID=A0A6L2K6B4_TANCI|nr:reverse transcriptase domain-containing protein [Tanacetum cinerariifolium]
MALGENTRDLGSFEEDTYKITDLQQIHEEGIKRRRRDLSSDGVRDLATASGRGRLKEDQESATLKKQKKDDEDERLLLIFKQIHINLPFLEAMIHMPKGAKVLKDLLSYNEKLKKAASSAEEEKEEDSNEVYAVSFYPRTEPIEPLEWKASENRLKQSCVEPPKLELKELPKHLEYAFLQENNQLPVVISSALSIAKKSRLLEVLKNHKGAIAWSIADIKGIDLSFCTHKILMKYEFKPSVQPQRRVNPNIKEVVPKKGGMTVVNNEKDELISQRTITGWRVCIGYPKFNNATQKYHFSLPFIDQMLERLAWNEYYCFLDEFPGYFQIPVALKDQEKTTFTCPCETYTYKRMLFGLCNAPTTFQRCMTAIFHELVEDSMEVFMDDFFVFDSSLDHYLKNLEKMLKRCEETILVLKWEKCHLMVNEGIVLGHKVAGSGIKVDKAKIKEIYKLPYPTNVKSIRSFLGHAGFYKRFIKDFSKITPPMTQLLVKDALFNFSEECIQAFDKLKCELTARAEDRQTFQPIHYASKTMNEAQENYTTTEKELLAVVFAFDKFCQYLILSKTIIFMDHSTLRDLRHYFWDESFLFKQHANRIIQRCVAGDEVAQILRQCHSGPSGGHHGIATTARKVFEAGFCWPHIFRDARKKLKSRWYRPFLVCKDMKNGAIELYDEDGNEFIVNKQRVKPYQKSVLDTNRDGDITLDDEGEVTSERVFSTWVAFGGNTRNLCSFREETDKITDLHQIHEEVLFTKHEDGVADIKRCRRDLSSEDVKDLAMALGRGQLKEDLESST